MHIRKIELTNIKMFNGFTWELCQRESAAGWHVFLGDNGAGKSTLLRACAMGLLGVAEVLKLRENFRQWLSSNADSGGINVYLNRHDEWDEFTRERHFPSDESLYKGVLLNFSAEDSGELLSHSISTLSAAPLTTHGRGGFTFSDKSNHRQDRGFFSASYGPFRRFSGGNPDYDSIVSDMSQLSCHLSLFGEDVALTETLAWLKDLRFQQLEQKEKAKPSTDGIDLLDFVTSFVNQDGFLPNGTQLTSVNSKAVVFTDANGAKVSIESLSDGYRSVLSLTLELIRQLCLTFPPERVFSEDGCTIQPPGVVLIDEVDVHLHPRWQRSIGPWFTRHFPNIQFIVTTHSPLVCQGAEHGTVTRLPQPGSDDKGGRITGHALERLLYGNILEAYSSGAFGGGVERSDTGERLYLQLAQLNRKSRKGRLNEEEQAERGRLQAIFGMDTQTSGV